jgi:hypothetical protein
MHCLACNCELTDVEATRKDLRGDYLDLCTYCFFEIRKDISLSNNFDLNIIEKEGEDE